MLPLPLLDHFSPNLSLSSGHVSRDGAVFLADTMDEEQIQETRTFLKEERSSWNHVMAVSQRAFAAVSDCLAGMDGPSWSLHMSFMGSDPHLGDDAYLSVLSHVHLHSLQLDLSKSNTSWNATCIHLQYNNSLKNTLTKLILPRYTLTGQISSGLMHFMHNDESPYRQRLSALTSLSIEMDDDLLPNEQRFESRLGLTLQFEESHLSQSVSIFHR